MIRRLATILEMIKFSHSVFALPYALLAAFLAAGGMPHWGQLALIVWCMVAARSAAMTFNRIVDADLDARNPRTAGRAIPARTVSSASAWVFYLLCAAAFVGGAWGFSYWFENPWPYYLAGPVLLFICLYSYSKRFTWLCHFWLGASLCLSPVAAWIAIAPATLGWPAAVLAGAVLLWVAGFDIIYACQDIHVDRQQRLFSMPADFGVATALWIARACHLGAACLLAWLSLLPRLGAIYLGGVSLVAVLLLVEHLLVKPDDLSRINVAFLTVNGCVSIVLAMAGITDLLLSR